MRTALLHEDGGPHKGLSRSDVDGWTSSLYYLLIDFFLDF